MRIIQKVSLNFWDIYDELSEIQKIQILKNSLTSEDLWDEAFETIAEIDDVDLDRVDILVLQRVFDRIASYMNELDCD